MADKKKIARITAGIMTGGVSVLAEKAVKKAIQKPEIKNEVDTPPALPPELTLENCIIERPNIPLKKGEVCVYMSPAVSVYNRKGVVAYKGGGQGVSFRVAKGVSLHTGGMKRTAERGTITDTYDGRLYMTNQRIILLAEKYGFDLKWENVTQIAMTGGPNECIVYHGTKSNIFRVVEFKQFEQIYNALCAVNFNMEQEDPKEDPADDPFVEIKKFKELLDMGIISQEEFDQKKKELLKI